MTHRAAPARPGPLGLRALTSPAAVSARSVARVGLSLPPALLRRANEVIR